MLTLFKLILLTPFCQCSPTSPFFPTTLLSPLCICAPSPTPYFSGCFPLFPASSLSPSSDVIFLSGRTYPSMKSLSLLELYSDYIRVNILQNNSSLLSFFNVYATSICSSATDSRTNSVSRSFLLPPDTSSFWGLQLSSDPLGL